MRSLKELSFRLRQEMANARLYLVPPTPKLAAMAPLNLLPSPEDVANAVRGTRCEIELVRLADQIMAGRIPVLGLEIAYGRTVAWRRDPFRGSETPAKYFRFIPYLHLATAGDHKLIWEVNRHQHLVVLAQAFVVTGRTAYLDEVVRQLNDWWGANPFQRGINWTSALEVGFRVLSWIWIWHLAGAKMPAEFQRRFLVEMYRHGLYLEHNLSIYFSPNTHLLGEAVALHALGRLFPDWPRADSWRKRGGQIVRQHLTSSVNRDGSYFEQSTYYHVYALDLFLFHAVLEAPDNFYLDGLSRMAVFLAALVNASGELALLGDDDGGRVFHPYGRRAQFARGTLATVSLLLERDLFPYSDLDVNDMGLWWLGPQKCGRQRGPVLPHQSSVFRDCGIVVMASGKVSALFDAGPFGPGSAGHSHSDTLSLVVWNRSVEILIDPGTYSYMDAQWREIFRGSAAHNTVRIDGNDQGISAGPFRWTSKPEVHLLDFASTSGEDHAMAVCRYRGFTHQRTVQFLHSGELHITDELEGPAGEHLVEQFWHAGSTPKQTVPGVWRIGDVADLIVEGGAMELGWRSRAFASREPSPVIVVRRRATLPLTLHAQLRMVS